MARTGDASPLKAAADLIQTLDIAYAEMTNNAADACRDAETARKNARAASEIARRYLHRSYPKVQSSFGGSPSTTPLPSPERNSSHRPGEKSTIHQDYKYKVLAEDPMLEINGIVSDLQTPRHYEESKLNNPLDPTPSSGRKRRTYQTPSSAERIAQSHAEDVLGLSMELERSKQGLKSEQRMHHEAKVALASRKSKNKSLEDQTQKLLKDLETHRQESTQTVSDLEQELANSKLRLQAAEEDAQLALDLAKESAEKRDQVEEWLQKALEELQLLKEEKANAAPETPRRSVRFADSTPPPPPPAAEPASLTTPRGGTPRSMVAAGRQLLRRSMGSPSEEVLTLELTPAKSAERRRRLRERLTNLEEDIPTPQRSPVSQRVEMNNSSHKKILEECQSAAKLLQESGQRLDLGGHWWRDRSASRMSLAQEIHLEAMTRQYSQSVEFKIERQQKELIELESLCGFLEKKLVTGCD